MQYEFLKQFPKRMKTIGRCALLLQNSSQKAIWKKNGFFRVEEQINFVFAVMLYLMEQSLKEDVCTIDDIGVYIDSLNVQFFEKNMDYEACKELGDFIINVVLANEGKAMYFDGYSFEQKAYQMMNISYVANKIVYLNTDSKRTSYYLTEDGYNLLLSTLEIENNMKLSIHEMIFKMHLEKQNYDKAVDEIKNVFQLLRIQLQKIAEAMNKIRKNALTYTVTEYQSILAENLDTISDTKQKFQNYREMVKTRAQEFQNTEWNVRKLTDKEEEKLANLLLIEQYLNRAIDEHQKILNGHFDLKSLYTKELELLSQVSSIKRFPFRTEFYDKVLQNPAALDRMDLFLRPLFCQQPQKIYNLKKVTELQRPISKKEEEDNGEVMDFSEEQWREEEEKRQREKRLKYETSLSFLLKETQRKGELKLSELEERLNESEEDRKRLIPSTDIFKEIMVELIRTEQIDIPALRKEQSEWILDKAGGFQLNEMILSLIDQGKCESFELLSIHRIEDGRTIEINNVMEQNGDLRKIRCSNVCLRMERGE